MNEDYEKFLKKIIVKAGKETLKYFGKVGVYYSKTSASDVVTKADLASEKIIIEAIKKRFPEHNIISEETGKNYKNSEYTWIIDPLDGTRNFASKTPLYCIMIAFVKGEEILVSGVYVPYFNQLYHAVKEKGAFLNGERIYCSKATEFNYSYGTGFATMKGGEYFKTLLSVELKTNYWINDFGCSGINAAYVFDGRRDWIFQQICGDVWDNAASVLLLQESGCKVTNMKGQKWTLKDKDVLAANPIIHKTIMEIIK